MEPDHDTDLTNEGPLIEAARAQEEPPQSHPSSELSSSPDSWPFAPPEVVGGCRILRLLGDGAMGCVYLAEQREPLWRRVALKMIKAGDLASDEEVKRFHAEAEAAAQLDHPGIIPIYEVGEYNGQHFFSTTPICSIAGGSTRWPSTSRSCCPI